MFCYFQATDDQYKTDVDDVIATAANLTDIQKMQAELFDTKFPFIQPSLNLVCKNCSVVSILFELLFYWYCYLRRYYEQQEYLNE